MRPPTSPMRMPTPVEPVNDTMSMSRVATRASPVTGVEPVTTLTTPGGKPTSCMMRTSSITASGFCEAGRTTTVLPIASAGPSFPAMFTTGKLYGVIAATAPTGWRRAIAPMSPPGASAVPGISMGGNGITFESYAMREYVSKRTRACGTCICLPTTAVHPVSAITSGKSSSNLSRIASATACSRFAAHLGGGLRPRREGVLRGPRRVERLLLRCLGRDADHFFGCGVDDLVAAVGAVDPVPADQELRSCHGQNCNAFYLRFQVHVHDCRSRCSISIALVRQILSTCSWVRSFMISSATFLVCGQVESLCG